MTLSIIKKLHKWLSLVIFVQLFIWLGSGLFFNLMDKDKARGNHYRQALPFGQVETNKLINVAQLMAQHVEPIVTVNLVDRLGKPYYLLTHKAGLYQHFYHEQRLVDAYTGQVKLVDKFMAQAQAKASYRGSADVISVLLLQPPITDLLKEKNALWQVNFADELKTSVYINANSGQLIAHSNDDRRFVDFFFMLHFMDYSLLSAERGFNNWQIIFFALITLFFCLTGMIWTIDLLIKGRYKLKG